MSLSLQRYTWPRPNPNSRLDRILKDRIEKERGRTEVISIQIGEALPENVIVEILSWLPVRALSQFKSVCKLWYAIISSPHFISKHLKNHYKNSDSDCLITHYYVTNFESQLHELLVDETPRVLADDILYDMPMYGSYICGPCDGIYYLYGPERALWNPVLNELKVLPPIINKPNLPSNITYGHDEVYGLGYDSTTDDYKVVVIKDYRTKCENYLDSRRVEHPLSVFIYSLRKDSWRYWGDLAQDYHMHRNTCYVVVNECFYWMASWPDYGTLKVIICFDMGADAIREINVPKYDQPAYKSLGIYHNSLAFLTIHEIEKRFDIWTWNEEGLWTKKFSMGPISYVWCPVGYWKKDTLVLEGDDRLFLCDPDTKEIKDLSFTGDHGCRAAVIYKESLLSVKDRNRRGYNEEAQTNASRLN